MGEIILFNASGSQVHKIMGDKGLGDTGKGYVREFNTTLWCGYRKEFSNKYTEKGLCMEDEAIELVSEVRDLGMLMKNTERKRNDHVNGECDISTKHSLRDVKCSWDAHTFPRYDLEIKNKSYIWQADTYLELWDKDVYFLDYVLLDAPEHVILREYWAQHRKLELEGGDLYDDLYEEVRSKMIHSHLPKEERVKTFEIKRDLTRYKRIVGRVEEGRIYQKTLDTKQIIHVTI